MYNKQVFFYIADHNGKITNKGSIISIAKSENGEMVITVKEQKPQYNNQNKRATA